MQLAEVGAFLRHSVVPEIIFKGHSRSLTMQSFARSPGFSIRHCIAGLPVYFRRKIAEVTSKIDQFSTTRSVVWPSATAELLAAMWVRGSGRGINEFVNG